MTRVKICGITRASDVRDAVDAGVDALGFNLAGGPRRIGTARAAALIAELPPFVTAVALFVDAPLSEILEALRSTRSTAVQLHGDEPPELAEALRRRVPVLKAFRIRDAASLEAVRGYPADAYLFDAYVAGQHGGTGVAFDHELIANAAIDRPVVLAGGLTPANVGAAVARIRPWAVDCSSGVECAPGQKDRRLMAAFVAAVRSA